MKIIIKLILSLVLVVQLNAQSIKQISLNDLPNYEVQKNIELGRSINITKDFNLLIGSQFGGLFDESFKNVYGIENLKTYFEDFDFGMTLSVVFEIVKNLNFTSIYNVGLLKFNLKESGNIKGAIIKTSLCYNF